MLPLHVQLRDGETASKAVLAGRCDVGPTTSPGGEGDLATRRFALFPIALSAKMFYRPAGKMPPLHVQLRDGVKRPARRSLLAAATVDPLPRHAVRGVLLHAALPYSSGA